MTRGQQIESIAGSWPVSSSESASPIFLKSDVGTGRGPSSLTRPSETSDASWSPCARKHSVIRRCLSCRSPYESGATWWRLARLSSRSICRWNMHCISPLPPASPASGVFSHSRRLKSATRPDDCVTGFAAP